MKRPVSKAERARDAIAIGVLGVGAALYAWAWAGMRALASGRIVGIPGHPALARWDEYRRISRGAIVVMILGALALAWSHIRYRQSAGSDEG